MVIISNRLPTYRHGTFARKCVCTSSVLLCKLVMFMIILFRQNGEYESTPVKHNLIILTWRSPSWRLEFQFCNHSSLFFGRVSYVSFFRFLHPFFSRLWRTSYIFWFWSVDHLHFGHPSSFTNGSWIFH